MSSALDFFPTKTMTLSDGSILTMKSVKIPRFSSSPPSIIKTFQDMWQLKSSTQVIRVVSDSSLDSSRLITGHTVTSWDDGRNRGRILRMWTRQFQFFKGQGHLINQPNINLYKKQVKPGFTNYQPRGKPKINFYQYQRSYVSKLRCCTEYCFNRKKGSNWNIEIIG